MGKYRKTKGLDISKQLDELPIESELRGYQSENRLLKREIGGLKAYIEELEYNLKDYNNIKYQNEKLVIKNDDLRERLALLSKEKEDNLWLNPTFVKLKTKVDEKQRKIKELQSTINDLVHKLHQNNNNTYIQKIIDYQQK